ncbi:hypothetical protein OSB04_012994 [Centaurea solstitialis]|uniref:RRM domain-containing protein n=1 Tax=Centaurea solstitialis TaxID=347529 RepID=A0AA38WMY3_9ASTR|nr:hypothetical protein OSB04_012994 [Centaurea solstitialis]
MLPPVWELCRPEAERIGVIGKIGDSGKGLLMDSTDDLTFRIIFSGDGAGRLRDRVKEKLKEFMGDYTDDTLVVRLLMQEYVIVLLKNGRRKEEARNELNVFLGDDSDSFVSWLWDHLRSNLHLYAQSRESRLDEVAKQKTQPGKEDGRSDLPHFNSESEGVKSEKLPKSRRNKDWKGVIRDPDEPPPLRSAVIANIHAEDKSHHSGSHMKRSPSPQPLVQRKRGRSGERGRTDERGQPDERAPVKREVVPKSTLGASRRLLQFAVRDAVATSRPTGLTSEPSLKRLRSVVSTPTEDSPLEERRPKIRSVARVPKAMAVAIKAVADAAKDVVKVKPSGNVFDRLGRSMDVSDGTDQFNEDGEMADEDNGNGNHQGFTRTAEATVPTYRGQSDYSDLLEHDAGINTVVAYDTEGYNSRNALYRRIKVDPSQIGSSGGQLGNDSMMLHYNAANIVDGTVNRPHRDQNNTPVAVANSAPKIVNISSNVNTWKPPPHHQEQRGVSHMDNQKLVQVNELGAGNYGVRVIKDSSNSLTVSNGNGVPTVNAQREMQKTPSSTGVYPTGRPTEDVDSRTIFVSNVHFAATKDSLSRHFNKFGDVLKVVIVTEAATGQPKGFGLVLFLFF